MAELKLTEILKWDVRTEGGGAGVVIATIRLEGEMAGFQLPSGFQPIVSDEVKRLIEMVAMLRGLGQNLRADMTIPTAKPGIWEINLIPVVKIADYFPGLADA